MDRILTQQISWPGTPNNGFTRKYSTRWLGDNRIFNGQFSFAARWDTGSRIGRVTVWDRARCSAVVTSAYGGVGYTQGRTW
jgi:hypothetical protein